MLGNFVNVLNNNLVFNYFILTLEMQYFIYKACGIFG